MILRSILSLFGFMALVACSVGSDNQKGALGEVYDLARNKFSTRSQAAPPPMATASVREALIKVGQPFLLVRLENAGATSLLALSQDRGNAQIWFSSDKSSVTLESGVITQTKGLGYDLYSADASGTIAAIRNKGASGRYARTHRRLDSANGIQKIEYQCSLTDAGQESVSAFDRTYTARHLREDCTSDSDSFTHDYWVTGNGLMIASRQRISPEFGFVRLERLSN